MKKLAFCIGLLALISLNSCSTDPCGSDKVQFLDKYNSFMEEVDDLNLEYSDEKWEEYDEQFKKMVEECYEIHEEEFTRKEERKFWAKTVTYYIQRYGTGFASELNNDNSKLNLAIKEHFGSAKGELRNALRDIDIDIDIDGEELEALVDELGDDIGKLGKKWGKKLEKLLEKDK